MFLLNPKPFEEADAPKAVQPHREPGGSPATELRIGANCCSLTSLKGLSRRLYRVSTTGLIEWDVVCTIAQMM